MKKELTDTYTTIFVDCFSTIIFRKIQRKSVFKNWSKKLSEIYNFKWKDFYKLYKHTNFKMCFKKLFTTFTLQEEFDYVLKKVCSKFEKKHPALTLDNFYTTAYETYLQKELDCFSVNTDLICTLKKEKEKGKKIYVVSDFYCKSTILEGWFQKLGIYNIFDKIYSSCDFYKEKATTKLYRKLIKELNLSPKEIIMFGDNLWSDIMMAKLCRIKGKRIKKPKDKI